MTFVAQPYERFADDLLLALTGGVTREEHRFVGTDETYSLATPGAYVPSIRVFGQRSHGVAVFERGGDYDLEGDDPVAIRWKPGGRTPDELSYFYVGYDLLDVRRRLTDRNPGSVTSILSAALGRELAVLHKEMETVYWSGFVDTATGVALDHVGALLGLTRRDARFASGEVLFSRTTPAPGDIALPAGTLVSTLEGVVLETSDSRTLRRGQLSVGAPVRAVQEGPSGQVPERAIMQINRPIFGVDAVVNERATAFASERESDDELRRRVKGALERTGKSTVDAIRYALIEELPEVTDANVQVVERADTPGLVEVRLGIADPAGPDLVRRVEEAIFNARPAGVRVTHNLPTRTPTDSARRAASRQVVLRGASPAIRLPQAVLAGEPDGSLRLRVQVLLRLSERNMAVAQKERIADDVRGRLVDYVERLPMGSDLVHARLLARAIEPEEVTDAIVLVGTSASGARVLDADAGLAAYLEARIYSPALAQVFSAAGVALDAAAVTVRPRGRGWEIAEELGGQTFSARVEEGRLVVVRGFYAANLATEDRKARLSPSDVAVEMMDEAVVVDVKVALQARADAPEGASAPSVTPAVQRALEDAVNRVLLGSHARLCRADLVAAVRGELDTAASGLQLVAGQAVALNAEFVETGRLLNAVDEVPLDENHVLHLRTVDVTIPGALDAPS